MSEQTSIRGNKFIWNMNNTDDTKVRALANVLSLSLPIVQTLYSRGFTTEEQIRSFLFSSYESSVAHASLFKDAEVAVERILKAIANKEKILIFGDYDVDGITSTSIMLVALIPLGAVIEYFLPNRVKDGYGLSSKIVTKAFKSGYKLIVTVDNGTTAFEAAETAAALGMDLIITDHHRPHGATPKAIALVNPHQETCAYPFKNLAGVGVIFKMMCLLYEKKGMQLPDKIYELLLLGTVADVVPLLDENRYWVQHGLAKLNKKKSYAMTVLANNSNLSKARWSSLDIGFMIAPQLNALGRLDDARDAVKFMVSSDMREVDRVGQILKDINEERKRVDRRIFDEIEESIFNKQIDVSKEHCIMAASKNWPAGVIGLVAGKLMHSYGRPTLLFHLGSDGLARGSCRSISEISIFDALESCKDLLITFGGHSCAAGLKLEQKNLPALKERLEAIISKQKTIEELAPKIQVDAYLELGDLTKKTMDDLERLEPFGNLNAQPTFCINDVTMQKAPQLLKDKHPKVMVFSQGVIKPVIFFNRPDLYQTICELGEKPFSIAGHAVKNEWNDNVSIELQGLDIAV